MRKLAISCFAALLVFCASQLQAADSYLLKSLNDIFQVTIGSEQQRGNTLVLRDVQLVSQNYGNGIIGTITIENENEQGIDRVTLDNVKLDQYTAENLVYTGIRGNMGAATRLMPLMLGLTASIAKSKIPDQQNIKEFQQIFAVLKDFHVDQVTGQNLRIGNNKDSSFSIEKMVAENCALLSSGPARFANVVVRSGPLIILQAKEMGWQGYDFSGLGVLMEQLDSPSIGDSLTPEQISQFTTMMVNTFYLDHMTSPAIGASAGQFAINGSIQNGKAVGSMRMINLVIPGALLQEFNIPNYPERIEANLLDNFTVNLLDRPTPQMDQSIAISAQDLFNLDMTLTLGGPAKKDFVPGAVNLNLVDFGVGKLIPDNIKNQLVMMAQQISPQMGATVRDFLVNGGTLSFSASDVMNTSTYQTIQK